MKSVIRIVGSLSCVVFGCAVACAGDYYLADGDAWPGKVLRTRGDAQEVLAERPVQLPDDGVPRVQSLTTLADGRLVFCSGLDRGLFELSPRGERRLRYGGYLARQVRAANNGTLYFSGLETPRDGDPLPDGFISACDPATGNVLQQWTFSQADVGHDWWGAFDVRDGRIFVGTLRGHTSIYDITAAPVQRITTLPIAATAFRFASNGSLLACDGTGKLYRFADLTDPGTFEIVLRSAARFVDFAPVP